MPTILVDGFPVEYAQSGDGRDLLLLHSLLTDATVFEPTLAALAREHRVTCINLPGFGLSAPRSFATVDAYADNVVRTMDTLGLPATTDLFGNGFGAFIALALAIRHGPRIGKVIAADVVPAFPETARVPFRIMASRVRQSGMNDVLDAALNRMLPSQFQQRCPHIVAVRKQRLASVDPACFAQACVALSELDLREHLRSVRNQCLVICGALDVTTPPHLAKEVAELIPDAIYREIADSGHCPMLERPNELISLMSDFLKKAEST